MRCERCQSKTIPGDLFDYCAKCSKNLCETCMESGCCGKTPAESGTESDHNGLDPYEDAAESENWKPCPA